LHDKKQISFTYRSGGGYASCVASTRTRIQMIIIFLSKSGKCCYSGVVYVSCPETKEMSGFEVLGGVSGLLQVLGLTIQSVEAAHKM
jgi:hypothetical protein